MSGIPDEELNRWERETGEHRDSYPLDPDEFKRGLLDGTICIDCAEPVEECQAKALVKGACWRWNDGP